MADFESYRVKRNAYIEAAIKRGHLKDGYQDEETQADPKKGRKIIKNLRDENGIEDRMSADVPEYEDIFEEALSDDPGGAILYKDYLDKLTEMVEIAERETAERRASSDLTMELLFKLYYRPDVELELRRNVTGAFLEYNYSVELACRKLSYIRTACMYYGIFLVKDIPVDRIISEKIKEILNDSVEVFKDDMPLSEIPGFTVPFDGEMPHGGQDGEVAYEMFSDYDSIMAGTKEIGDYILKHPQQIDAQCLMSVVTGTAGLYEIHEKARILDRAIDSYSITEEGRNLDGHTWRELFNVWIMVKAFARVTELIISFVNEYRDSTVGEATKALEELLPAMSYALVQRNVRIALRQTILEGSVYEFRLSEVVISDAVKKAAGKIKCMSFKEAPDKGLAFLMSMIQKDKRLISIPDDYDISYAVRELSFISIRDGKPCGAVFVSEDDEALILENVYVLDNLAVAGLVNAAYEAAMERYGADKKVQIPVISDRSAKLIEGFVPGAFRERLVRAQKK